jgi:hypothetical protein
VDLEGIEVVLGGSVDHCGCMCCVEREEWVRGEEGRLEKKEGDKTGEERK